MHEKTFRLSSRTPLGYLLTSYKIFSFIFSGFPIINCSQEELKEKENVDMILTTVSDKVQFFTEQKLCETIYDRDMVSCERVEHSGLKLKRLNLNIINMSKTQ